VTAPKVHPSEKTKTLSWELKDGTIELALHHPPCNEMGTAMLEDLEQFVATLESAEGKAGALIVYSRQEAGFSAGADLRELYGTSLALTAAERVSGVRTFLERMHRVPERHRCFTADHDCRGAWCYVRRRLRAGAGLRSDYRG